MSFYIVPLAILNSSTPILILPRASGTPILIRDEFHLLDFPPPQISTT